MKRLLPLILAACAGTSDKAAEPTDADDATPCGEALCISTSADTFEEGTLVLTSLTQACFWGSGFGSNPPPRIIVDGAVLGLGGGNGGTCLSAADLPVHLPSGELWVEQGTDEDGDGEPDPGSVVASNHLPLITPPWLTGADRTEATSGEPVVLGVENLSDAVPWTVYGARGCGVDVLASTADTITITPLWDSREDLCPLWIETGWATGMSNASIPDEAPVLEVLPRLDLSCHAAPGEACTIHGVGFGTPDADPGLATAWAAGQDATLTLDGTLYAPGPGDGWGPNGVGFTMPALPAGAHRVVLTTAYGRTVEADVTTLRWTRKSLVAPAPGHSYDHEGALFAVAVGFTVPPFGALETRQVAFAPAEFGGNTHVVTGIPHPELPFAATSHTMGVVWEWDACTRGRGTGVRDALDLAHADPHFIIAGRSRGPAQVVDWDGLPARTCELSDDIGVTGEEAPGRWSAFSAEVTGSLRTVVAGLARFDFGVDPPVPDPLGRPGREVPILAVRDDLAGTTELFLAYGPPSDSLFGPLEGRATLHEAGEVLYLAGGEPGFDGVLHEVQWTSERTIPTPIPVGPDQLPAFTGSPDGRLWSLALDDDGTAAIWSWDPEDSVWSYQCAVPEDVLGASTAALAVDPLAHTVADLAVLDGTPVLAVYREVPTGVRLVVVAWDGADWVDVGEPITGLRVESFHCFEHAGPETVEADCPAGTGRLPVSGWRTFEDVPSEARLLATDDALYVRYMSDEGASRKAWVASWFDPLF